jgi:hypothetical protein
MYQLKSVKGLYSNTFLDEKKFWDLYGPKENYELLKKKYDKNNKLINLFEKVVNNK